MTAFDEALTLWDRGMIAHGLRHAEAVHAAVARLDAGETVSGDEAAGLTYYDGSRVFYNIFDRTGDPRFDVAGREAARLYRDAYVLPNDGGVNGYTLFPHGLVQDWLRHGDAASRDAAILVSRNAAYGSDLTADNHGDWLRDASLSRENAYNLMAQLLAETLGEPHRSKTDDRLRDCLGHFDQWFISRTKRPQPFMVALSCEALVLHHAITGDPRVLPAIRAAGEGLWAREWRPADACFNYALDGSPDGAAPDLNLLIVPIYGWLYAQTKDRKYIEWGDLIFAGGAGDAKSFLAKAKQFNQNYRWSFDYVEARAAATPPPRRRSYFVTMRPTVRMKVDVVVDGEPKTIPMRVEADGVVLDIPMYATVDAAGTLRAFEGAPPPEDPPAPDPTAA